MIRRLEVFRSVGRYLAARSVGSRLPGLLSSGMAPLRLRYGEEPQRPNESWVRVKPRLAGICGSDLSTISGRSSFYFSALVSMPFVPGHEVVGETLDDAPGIPGGARVVIDPVLGCAARGIDPPCEECAEGRHGLCERVTGGHVSPGLQTGFCRDTSGGWSEMLVAHVSQLHPIPDEIADEDAVMIEPLACAIHSVRKARVPRDATVLVVGAGTVGLLTLVALRRFTEASRVIVVAKYEAHAELARRLGATDVVSPRGAIGSVRRSTRAFEVSPERSAPFLLGGADVSFECAGSRSALDLAIRATRARGRVVLAGMPAGADLSPAWFRELRLTGTYSGAGSFAEARELAADAGIGKLVSAAYPLANWRDAIDHALSAGGTGAVKIVFDPRLDEEGA